MGTGALNCAKGIPTLTNETIHSTYEILDKLCRYWGVHTIGEVWEEMLWVVLALHQ